MAHLHGPRVMHGAKTPRDFEAKHFATLADLRDRFGDARQVHPADRSAAAFVSEGRWVVSCHECYGGAAVDVDAGVARCFECGAVYVTEDGTLVLPSGAMLAAIDEILGARAEVRTRNWAPGETLHRLRLENKEHGVPAAAKKGRR